MRSFATGAQRPEPRSRDAVAAPVSIGLDADVVRLVDRLVDVIAVRESYEPETAGWDTGHLIRRLERELAQAWPGGHRESDSSLDDVAS